MSSWTSGNFHLRESILIAVGNSESRAIYNIIGIDKSGHKDLLAM